MLLSSYTKFLRRYDKDLFCDHNRNGILCVFRKWKRFEPVCVDDNFKILNLITDKQFVCALTENWTLSTKPRQWGIDHVLTKIRQMDLQANERLFEEMDQQNEKVDESEKRSFRNEAEAFWSDNRRAFAKATDGILTHSLSKDEPRKRLRDRRNKKWEL